MAGAALDCLTALQLARGELGEALASTRARGASMDPLPLSAATAYGFNDYLLMGCEVSLAAGDLPGARAFAERLAALPCYREYVHPALARRVQVDALTGDIEGAAARGVLLRASWERAGRHRANTLAVGTWALGLVHGLLGDDDERARWQEATAHLLGEPELPGWVTVVGWAPALDAVLLLHRDRPDEALAVLAAPLDDPAWGRSTTMRLWRPWYAAARAEAAVLSGAAGLDPELAAAGAAVRGNPVAGALVRRASAFARGDVAELDAVTRLLQDQGAGYQAARTARLRAVASAG